MSNKKETPALPNNCYFIDPNTNPATWDGPISTENGQFVLHPKVDVIFMNINLNSDVRIIRTGTNGSVHEALLAVAKHVEKGLYKIVSLQMSEYSCVVVMETQLMDAELVKDENQFPL